jgi:ApaG protein
MYRAITEGIEVQVVPSFAPERSSLENGAFFWIYDVEIRNLSDAPVQLKARHWEITDATGRVQHVRGQGVVGQQPVIAPGESFHYTSGCPLGTSSGIMAGEYEMVDAEGRAFVVAVPAFSLDVPHAPRALN